MIQLLLAQPLLLLFVVLAIGFPLGRLQIGGFSLGLASVLFAGLGVGALHPELRLPEFVYQLGLVLFVYTIGLQNGRAFFGSLRSKGLKASLMVTGILLGVAGLALLLHWALGLSAAMTAGLFSGALTSTPSLAGVLESLHHAQADPELLAQPVVGYSVAYPMGVVGMLLCIAVCQRLWKVDYAAEQVRLRAEGTGDPPLQSRTIRVTRPEVTSEDLHALQQRHQLDVVFGRRKRDGRVVLATADSELEIEDRISLVGPPDALERATDLLGEISDERLELDRSELDYRRIFVSNPRIAGVRLRDLNLPQHLGALITRVRRGDVELLPRGETVLQLGDRVRVVAHREQMEAIGRFFGDSYRALSEIDILTFSMGLALGLLLGLIPIPIPGGLTLRLGLAGGPLIVALVLGALERTGPMLWSLPYSANLTLRQIGLVFFFAGVGTRSGHAFATTLASGGGIALFLGGALLTCTAALTVLWVGHRLLKMPMTLLLGTLAGFQTQPAVLSFALNQTKSDLPNIGYATVVPIAMIVKILLAQILLALLS